MNTLTSVSFANPHVQFDLELQGNLPEHIREDSDFQDAASILMDEFKALVLKTAYRLDPDVQQHVSNQKKELLECFDGVIYAKEIPNGYSNGPYWSLFPWFEVTTKIGVFVIGWRKRVVEIQWNQTLCRKPGGELFQDENVTKGPFMIHAWSLDKVKQYLRTITKAASI